MDKLFPTNSIENLVVAKELLGHLHENLSDTYNRREWSSQNFQALQSFAVRYDAISYPSGSGKDRKPEFLWDYVAHKDGDGILLAAESEHNRDSPGVKHDFEKLLYAQCPLKLMLIRISSKAEAERQAAEFGEFMFKCTKRFTAGDVFIIYCVWWAQEDNLNSDLSYLLQIPGDQGSLSATQSYFEPFAWNG